MLMLIMIFFLPSNPGYTIFSYSNHLLLKATFLFLCQESFTCARTDDAFPCADAPTLYSLNENFGVIPDKNENSETSPQEKPVDIEDA